MPIALDSREAELRRFIFNQVPKAEDEELQSYLCRLGAVMVCGYIERSIEIIILNKLDKRAHPRILSFVKGHFQRGTNYDCNAITQLLHRFDTQWAQKFQEFVSTNEELDRSISSCYGARNAIAHGISQGLGQRILQKYFENSVTLIARVDIITS